MKSLSEYLLESGKEQEDQVWVIKDKDLDGAILDVCESEEDANEAFENHKKENEGCNIEIVPCKRSEVEKKED